MKMCYIVSNLFHFRNFMAHFFPTSFLKNIYVTEIYGICIVIQQQLILLPFIVLRQFLKPIVISKKENTFLNLFYYENGIKDYYTLQFFLCYII